jgi:hypothetical protein
MGDCQLQLAAPGTPQSLDRYGKAIEAYQTAIDSPVADGIVRSMAEVGMGIAREKMAAHVPPADRTGLLDQALKHYLNVAYQRNLRAEDRPDPFWVKEAGLAAGNLAETMGKIPEARALYARLRDMFPPMKSYWDRRLEALDRVTKSSQR